VLAIISQAASAHVGGGQPFPIFELSTDELPDIHDGSLDDWEEVLPSFSLNQDQFAPLNVNDGAGIDTADLAYRVFMAWHSAGNHLYVAIERVDDVYVNTYEGGDLGNVWQHDSIEFMVDGDHTGGKYNRYLEEDGFGTEEAKLLSGFQAQQYFAIAVSPDNNTLGYGGAATWAVAPPFSNAGGFTDNQESPNTSVIEMFITPWDELDWRGPERSRRTELIAGKILGFQVSIPDFDAGCFACDDLFLFHGYHTLSGQPLTWREADNFVDGELIACTTGDCGSASSPVTAVESNSWGRIKASFAD
jgi:hypothetical protein